MRLISRPAGLINDVLSLTSRPAGLIIDVLSLISRPAGLIIDVLSMISFLAFSECPKCPPPAWSFPKVVGRGPGCRAASFGRFVGCETSRDWLLIGSWSGCNPLMSCLGIDRVSSHDDVPSHVRCSLRVWQL